MKRTILYRGYTVELGELPEPRKGYWAIFTDGDSIPLEHHEVECNSWQDLELIAKRSIDAQTQRQ